jgi:SAM-dependent methyltransferase
MHGDSHIQRLIAPFGPRRPPYDLVVDINLLYHAAEAPRYDKSHPEIFDQLPRLWELMVEQAIPCLPQHPLHVLDYGCGTGFAATQVLSLLGTDRIAQITCYDPSPEMLERCRMRFRHSSFKIRFCASEAAWASDQVPKIDLILTNSLLHHLPNPISLMQDLRQRLGAAAAWIAGHEPSRRFYDNPECVAVWRRFRRARKLHNLLSPRVYWDHVSRRLRLSSDPATIAAQRAYKMGWFSRRPTPRMIDRLVDLHVAHSPEEAGDGRGLDFEHMAQEIENSWRLRWVHSYSFLGSIPESAAPERWRLEAANLLGRHPLDGANFCTVWQAI